MEEESFSRVLWMEEIPDLHFFCRHSWLGERLDEEEEKRRRLWRLRRDLLWRSRGERLGETEGRRGGAARAVPISAKGGGEGSLVDLGMGEMGGARRGENGSTTRRDRSGSWRCWRDCRCACARIKVLRAGGPYVLSLEKFVAFVNLWKEFLSFSHSTEGFLHGSYAFSEDDSWKFVIILVSFDNRKARFASWGVVLMVGETRDVVTKAAVMRVVWVDYDSAGLGDLAGAILDARANMVFWMKKP